MWGGGAWRHRPGDCCLPCSREPEPSHIFTDNPIEGCPTWDGSGSIPRILHLTVTDCAAPCDHLIGLTFTLQRNQDGPATPPHSGRQDWTGYGCRTSPECDPPLGCAAGPANTRLWACLGCYEESCGQIGYRLTIETEEITCDDPNPPDACGERVDCGNIVGGASVQTPGGLCFPFYRRFAFENVAGCCCSAMSGNVNITIEVTE